MQLCPDLPVLCHVFGFAAGPGAGRAGVCLKGVSLWPLSRLLGRWACLYGFQSTPGPKAG